MVNKDKNSILFAKNNFYGLSELLSELSVKHDQEDFRILWVGHYISNDGPATIAGDMPPLQACASTKGFRRCIGNGLKSVVTKWGEPTSLHFVSKILKLTLMPFRDSG